MASSELVKRSAHEVDPQDEPSAAWGWHGRLPRGRVIWLLLSAIVCLGMVIGNHESHVEDFYLVGIAVLIFGYLIAGQVKARTSWRR